MRKRTKQRLLLICFLLGALGFAGSYFAIRAKDNARKNFALERTTERDTQDDKDRAQVSSILEPKKKEPVKPPVEEKTTEKATNDQEVQAKVQEEFHFLQSHELTWPYKGDVLLNYSMDASIYFPTLEEYRYHPAIVIRAKVNEPVYAAASGTITKVETNEETGVTVIQDLGDGYTATYGQLKDINGKEGDILRQGDVIGYVGEPTKYYAVEGDNVYFALHKDEEPVNPFQYLQ